MTVIASHLTYSSSLDVHEWSELEPVDSRIYQLSYTALKAALQLATAVDERKLPG